MKPCLVTIPISHYCERARWALDLAGVDYDERQHLQMFSWVAALRHGRGKMLPVLVTEGGAVTDSGAIVEWCAARGGASLFPEDGRGRDEVLLLSRSFAGSFGIETRRFAYDCLIGSGTGLLGYNEGDAPDYQKVIVRRGFAFVKWVATGYLGVRPAELARGLDEIDRTFDDVAERLEGGRPYLVGDSFSAADLTFAAMASPCLLPERYGVPLPAPAEVPAHAQERIARWREHPAGRFATRLYDARPTPRGLGGGERASS